MHIGFGTSGGYSTLLNTCVDTDTSNKKVRHNDKLLFDFRVRKSESKKRLRLQAWAMPQTRCEFAQYTNMTAVYILYTWNPTDIVFLLEILR